MKAWLQTWLVIGGIVLVGVVLGLAGVEPSADRYDDEYFHGW